MLQCAHRQLLDDTVARQCPPRRADRGDQATAFEARRLPPSQPIGRQRRDPDLTAVVGDRRVAEEW